MKEAFRDKEQEWTHVVQKALTDQEFKGKLFSDPIPVLKEFGIEFPEGIKVNVVEGNKGAREIRVDRVEGKESEIVVKLPSTESLELTDESLLQIVGGEHSCILCPTVGPPNPQITD